MADVCSRGATLSDIRREFVFQIHDCLWFCLGKACSVGCFMPFRLHYSMVPFDDARIFLAVGCARGSIIFACCMMSLLSPVETTRLHATFPWCNVSPHIAKLGIIQCMGNGNPLRNRKHLLTIPFVGNSEQIIKKCSETM